MFLAPDVAIQGCPSSSSWSENILISEYFHIHHVIIQPGVAGVVERIVHGTNLFPRRPHLPKMSLPPLPCLTTLALCNRIHSSYLEMNTLVLLYFYLTFTVDSTLALHKMLVRYYPEPWMHSEGLRAEVTATATCAGTGQASEAKCGLR